MARPLITAQDVAASDPLVLPPGAIVTPLARDLLRKRGVTPLASGDPQSPPERLVIANWKSHKTVGEALDFARALRSGRGGRAAAVICPPFTALAPLHAALEGAALLGAQDVSPHAEGAHTGEVAARHLLDVGCTFALVGHSERRHAGEGDALCARKARAALSGGLRPVVCVGETSDERRAGRTQRLLTDQLRAVFEGLDPAQVQRTVVAYEPRWAIGAGVTPAVAEVAEVLAHVRAVLERTCGEAPARQVPLLYGGSVNEANAGELLATPGCAGALVGGAALSPQRFLGILAASSPG